MLLVSNEYYTLKLGSVVEGFLLEKYDKVFIFKEEIGEYYVFEEHLTNKKLVVNLVDIDKFIIASSSIKCMFGVI